MNQNIKKAHEEAEVIKKLNEETEKINLSKVKSLIDQLEQAYNIKDVNTLKSLIPKFEELSNILGNDTYEIIMNQIASIKLNIEELENGEDLTKVNASDKDESKKIYEAQLRNCEAKRDVHKYKDTIQAAAAMKNKEFFSEEDHLYHFYKAREKRIDKRNALFTAASIVTVGALIGTVAFANKACNKKNNNVVNNTSSSITTTLTDSQETTTDTTVNETTRSSIDEVFETTTVETTEVPTDETTKFTLETIDLEGYTSPTRPTNQTGSNGGSSRTERPDTTYQTVGTTHASDDVTVVVTPIPTPKPVETTVSTETSAVTTNESGVKVDEQGETIATTSYQEPDGTDELPIEPVDETIDIFADCEYTVEEVEVAKNRKVLVYRLS